MKNLILMIIILMSVSLFPMKGFAGEAQAPEREKTVLSNSMQNENSTAFKTEEGESEITADAPEKDTESTQTNRTNSGGVYISGGALILIILLIILL